MTSEPHRPLITAEDIPPVAIVNPGGTSSFLLIGDHAGNAVPNALASLGITSDELSRHIGWDIGIAETGAMLAERLDAVFIRQAYSRLVVDCNRSPAQPDAIAEVSDTTVIPGNLALSDEAKAERFAAIHEPYHAAIAHEVARRTAAGRTTILIALHSFTPLMRALATSGDRATATLRPWHIGILHDGGDTTFATALLSVLNADPDLVVGDNEPYRMDLIDYTIPRHAYPDRLPYAEIEIRQDLISDHEGCRHWADRIAHALVSACAS
jgi:predicted N-formylglutamate amidohydrolase